MWSVLVHTLKELSKVVTICTLVHRVWEVWLLYIVYLLHFWRICWSICFMRLIWVSLVMNAVQCLFICLFSVWISSLVKYLFWHLPIFVEFASFFLVIWRSALQIPDGKRSFTDRCTETLFSPYMAYLFTLSSTEELKFLILM